MPKKQIIGPDPPPTCILRPHPPAVRLQLIGNQLRLIAHFPEDPVLLTNIFTRGLISTALRPRPPKVEHIFHPQ